MKPLTDIRVVAVEQAVAAPLCTRHLADLGAEVIKVEAPGGDFARHYDTVVGGQSSYFVWLNRGKRSTVLDLKSEHGRAALADLLVNADVFVHNLGPGAMDRIGFAAPHLTSTFPRLIHCAISGYGSGPPSEERKAFDLLIQAESGVMSLSGVDGSPGKMMLPVADLAAGMYALSSVLASLVSRSVTGLGQALEIAMIDCMAEWMTVPLYYADFAGLELHNRGAPHETIAPYGPVDASDGQVVIAVQNQSQWERLCAEGLRRPAVATDPRFRDNGRRVTNRDALADILRQTFEGMDVDRVTRILDRADVPYGIVNSVRQFSEHPQLVARDRWELRGTPTGPVRSPRSPFTFAAWDGDDARVPALGEFDQSSEDTDLSGSKDESTAKE